MGQIVLRVAQVSTVMVDILQKNSKLFYNHLNTSV